MSKMEKKHPTKVHLNAPGKDVAVTSNHGNSKDKRIEVKPRHEIVRLNQGEIPNSLEEWIVLLSESKKEIQDIKEDNDVIVELIKSSLGCDNVAVIKSPSTAPKSKRISHRSASSKKERGAHKEHSYSAPSKPLTELLDHLYTSHTAYAEDDINFPVKPKRRQKSDGQRIPKSKVCEFCGKTFHCHAYMLTHVRKKHSLEKPFLCDLCGKSHCTKADLKKHVKNHICQKRRALNPFSCSHCSRSFHSRVKLRLHCDKLHRPTATQAVKEEKVEKMDSTEQENNAQESVTLEELEGSIEKATEELEGFMEDVTVISVESTGATVSPNTDEPSAMESVEMSPNIPDSTPEALTMSNVDEEDEKMAVSLTEREKKVYESYKKQGHYSKTENVKCDLCGFISKNYQCYINHVLHVHDTHECPMCQEVMSSMNQLKEHLLSVHEKQQPQFNCDLCGKEFYIKSKLTSHMRVHDKTETLCETCGREFSNTYRLKRHIRETHNKKVGAKPICEICGADFISTRGLFDHKRRKHNLAIHDAVPNEASVLIQPIDIHCEQCGEKFTKEKARRHHVTKYHTGTMKEQCGLCEFRFNDFRVYRFHLFNAHSIGNDPTTINTNCPLCGRKFSENKKLITHLHLHYDLKPYKCDSCDKRFTSKHSLQKHSMTHKPDDIAPSRLCGICGRFCSSASDLKDHMNTHTGEKPHQCSFCMKAFSHKNALKLHEALHSGVKPFKCELCDAAYSTKPSLKAHLKTHGKKVLQEYSRKNDATSRNVEKFSVPGEETQTFADFDLVEFSEIQSFVPVHGGEHNASTVNLEVLELT